MSTDERDPFHEAPRDTREYRVEPLVAPAVSSRGILHVAGDEEAVLPWDAVQFAIAALVGEPEGVCAIVFDLLLEETETRIRVCRLDADPADGAIPLAVALADHLGRARSGASLLEMADKGSTDLWYPDLESFECAAASLLSRRRSTPPGA